MQRNALAEAHPDISGAHMVMAPVRPPPHAQPAREAPQAEGGAMLRMQELKKLREADMISEAEYQEKRAEILEKL